MHGVRQAKPGRTGSQGVRNRFDADRSRFANRSTRPCNDRRACLATRTTSEPDSIRFRILGALEAEVGDRAIELGGTKQRALLAALLLRAGEVVPVERLVDEIWGDGPPPSAAHGLAAYVSRLRQTLAPYGVSLDRRGAGYGIGLGDAVLDAQVFEELVGEASGAAAAGDHVRAAGLASQALSLWRGPVLAGISLRADGSAAAGRLHELRSRALEIRIHADLALGRHAELVAELGRLVEENPYRERLVAQLMVALYRSGRQAEALETYERTRRGLMDDLGIQPGPELQHLSRQIVRHEQALAFAPVAPIPAEPPRAKGRRRPIAVVAVALVAVLALAAVLVWGSGGGAARPAAAGTRVALVVPRPSTPGHEDAVVGPFVDALVLAARKYTLATRTFVLGDTVAPDQVARRLRHGLGFDLVFSAGLDPASSSLPPFEGLVDTRFVYVDASLRGTPLEQSRNATALSFADEKAGYLAGYLSALMAARKAQFRHEQPVVSVVGGPASAPVNALVRGFARGASKARPGIAVVVDRTSSIMDQAVCERIANRQIDRGSTVVFAAAGTCGFGALSAANLRGVWGVGSDADRSYLGPHILASTVKRIDRAVELAVGWYLQGALPQGDVVLGLDDDAVGISGINPEVPEGVRRKVAAVAVLLRATQAGQTPTPGN